MPCASSHTVSPRGAAALPRPGPQGTRDKTQGSETMGQQPQSSFYAAQDGDEAGAPRTELSATPGRGDRTVKCRRVPGLEPFPCHVVSANHAVAQCGVQIHVGNVILLPDLHPLCGSLSSIASQTPSRRSAEHQEALPRLCSFSFPGPPLRDHAVQSSQLLSLSVP